MALDLTGINNVGEFYSHHYLDAVLEGDLKAVFDRWKERELDHGVKAPEKRLAALAEDYFKASHASENLRGRAEDVRVERWHLARGFHLALLEALGYPLQPGAEPLEEEGLAVPVLTSLRRDGRPYLWAVEAPFPGEEDDTVLETSPLPEQMPASAEGARVPEDTWQELLDGAILRQEAAPRWVLLLGGKDVFLIDRTKWGQGKSLHFEIAELLGRKDREALRAMAGLLHRDVLCPEDGTCLHDQLEENSHKHAFGVSTDLKMGARRAIELLANEALWYLRHVSRDAVFTSDELADTLARELTEDALRYLYRLLFLFFVESRAGELELVPMKSDSYRMGYSLEKLRDLEQVPLTSEQARNGYFLDQSLRTLFRLVNEGFPTTSRRVARLRQQRSGERPRAKGAEDVDQMLLDLGLEFGPQGKQLKLDLEAASVGTGSGALAARAASSGTQAVLGLQWGGDEERDEGLVTVDFTIQGLRSPLFDDARLNRMGKVKFRNFVLQEVLELLSLSRPGKSKTRGRISYATLGINQLGAVYEGLLSYTGFFARTDVFEVRSEKAVADDEARTYFVPVERADEFREGEFVRSSGGDGRASPGSAIGDSRSPQSIAKRTRHAKGAFLFRLAGRDREKSASYYTPEVLTRCLTKYTLKERLQDVTADEILTLTICEPAMGSGAFLNEALNQLADAYLSRKQRELGVTIPSDQYQAEKQKVKYHLAVHNCYGVDRNPPATELGKLSLWLNILQTTREAATPFFGARIRVGNSLIGARRQVFKPESLTTKTKGKRWLDLVPEKVPFGTALSEDGIWHFLVPDQGMVPFDKDKVVAELEPENVARIKAWRKDILRPYAPFDVESLKRISRRVEELWTEHAAERQRVLQILRQPCWLFGQPSPTDTRPRSVEESEEALRALEQPNSAYGRLKAAMDYWCALWFWPIQKAELLPSRDEWLFEVESLLDPGFDLASAFRDVDRLAVVHDTADRHRFFAWELEFAEAFAGAGGFDVILGNPPWLKVEWEEGGILGDLEPMVGVRDLSAKKVADLRQEVLSRPDHRELYFAELEEMVGTPAYLNALQAYPALQGVQTNLYKCFLERGWALGSPEGLVGLLHQTGLFDDPKGGKVRAELWPRSRWVIRLQNKLQLFGGVQSTRTFAFTVTTASPQPEVCFRQVSNLQHPLTLDASIQHDGTGPVPGIKSDDNEWDLRGHRSRIVEIGRAELALFAALYDPAGTPPLQARLPVVHSRELLTVLLRFRAVPRRLADIADYWHSTVCFDETYAQRDGTIRRDTNYPDRPEGWVLSGPHFYVATPFYKNPHEDCSFHRDYSVIDHTTMPDDYLPRTNYVPACDRAEYRRRTPYWKGQPVTDRFRYVHREMVSPSGERTLVPSILPPGPAHIHTVFGIAFESNQDLVLLSALASSIVLDFFVKSTGSGHVNQTLAGQLPIAAPPVLVPLLTSRALRLNCLTTHYAPLWEELFTPAWQQDGFAKQDPRLPTWSDLTPTWQRHCALRTPYERRQALVELDALAALSLEMTLDELLTIYRVQFPVLRQFESDTWYDQRGHIIFTPNVHGLPGVGLTRQQWEEVKHAEPGDPLPDHASAYTPPFNRCDREEDMSMAYEHFRNLLT